MIDSSKAFSSFSVSDIAAAKAFYGEKLDMKVEDREMETLQLHLGSGARVLIYPKGAQHEPASFTVLNLPVGNIDSAVDDLIQRGIKFEQYTGETGTDAKGIFRGGEPLIAWFKDPAGNVISVMQE